MEASKIKATAVTIDARPSGVSLGRADFAALLVRLIRAGQVERHIISIPIDTHEAVSVLSQSHDTKSRKIAS